MNESRQLKNKAERESFLENYRAWELWKEMPELELKFYRYAIISTGAVIIATEYVSTYHDWQTKTYKDRTEVKYHLILLPSDKFYSNSTYRYPGKEYRHFELEGISKSNLVRYLTETKPNIESWLIEESGK